MQVLPDSSSEALQWLESRLDFRLGPNTRLIAAVNDFGRRVGAIAFGGRMGRTIGSVSIAVDEERAMLPLVRAGAVYLFGQLNMKAAYISVGSRRMKWWKKLGLVIGFKEVDRVLDGLGDGEDLVVMRLLAEDCRPWLSHIRKHRKVLQEVA